MCHKLSFTVQVKQANVKEVSSSATLILSSSYNRHTACILNSINHRSKLLLRTAVSSKPLVSILIIMHMEYGCIISTF